jgi:hypothetical protein
MAACAGLSIAPAARAQIVTNGDFETGDFTGWTQFGDTGFTGVDGALPHSGSFAAFFGPLDVGGIQQNLAANAGDRLIVSFWLATDFGDTPNSCQVTLDGQTVADLTDYTSTTYQQFTATITVTNASPLLMLSFTNPPDYFELDDLTVSLDSSGPPSCYANCDGSTAPPILNTNDFQCFLNKFAAGDSTANCDGSTAPPILNTNDFQCFLNKFAAGCS